MKTLQVEIKNRQGKILRGVVTLPDEEKTYPVVVNLHGFMGNKSGYRFIHTHMARALAEKGVGCVRFDFFGHGESDGEFEEMTFTTLLEDSGDIWEWTKNQPWTDKDKMILSGQSMGGYLAATMAPKLAPEALILMCPGAGMWFGCKERADKITDAGMDYADVEGLKYSMSFNYEMAKYPPFDTAAGYAGKVLLLRGDKDELVSDDICQQYCALYGKSAEFHRIEGGNHNFSSLPAKEACEKQIVAFVERIVK